MAPTDAIFSFDFDCFVSSSHDSQRTTITTDSLPSGVRREQWPLPQPEAQEVLPSQMNQLTIETTHPSLCPPPTISESPIKETKRTIQRSFDMTGQTAPPGSQPRVTCTYWEDEACLVFQVDVGGVCVSRREDSHMCNATKLLDVAGFSSERKDKVLEDERMKLIVQAGPSHLQGVWIPFERALDLANIEGITPLLYPLFVYDVGALLLHPVNVQHTYVPATHQELNQDQTKPKDFSNQYICESDPPCEKDLEAPLSSTHHRPSTASLDGVATVGGGSTESSWGVMAQETCTTEMPSSSAMQEDQSNLVLRVSSLRIRLEYGTQH